MANYRLIKDGRDKYRVIGIYTPAKGGAVQLVVADAKLTELGPAAKSVAEKIALLRPKPKTTRNEASEPKVKES